MFLFIRSFYRAQIKRAMSCAAVRRGELGWRSSVVLGTEEDDWLAVGAGPPTLTPGGEAKTSQTTSTTSLSTYQTATLRDVSTAPSAFYVLLDGKLLIDLFFFNTSIAIAEHGAKIFRAILRMLYLVVPYCLLLSVGKKNSSQFVKQNPTTKSRDGEKTLAPVVPLVCGISVRQTPCPSMVAQRFRIPVSQRPPTAERNVHGLDT
ncbi:hypothetical protein VTO42DRAFT_184 [Malbranchea cinnamomea]